MTQTSVKKSASLKSVFEFWFVAPCSVLIGCQISEVRAASELEFSPP